MRKIALLGIVLLSVAAFGCSKKTEESAESKMAPAPATQEAAPAQGMDSMGNESHPETPPGEINGAPQDDAKSNGAAE